jgi:hypothetical protein
MHRLTRYCAGWVAATCVATGVSWVAIQNLVTTAALSQPAIPLGAAAAPLPTVTSPGPTVTSSPGTITRAPATRAPRPPAAAPSSTPGRRAGTRTSGPAANHGTVQGYSLKGGQIVLELRPDSAALVSAVPGAGYQTQTWKTEYWIRVDFVGSERRSSLIVSWYEHAPLVQKTEF